MSRGRKKKHVSGEEAWDEAFRAVDHAPLLATLGVDLEPQLLKLALTHRSFANEHGPLPNNERLEFIGDAVLGLSVANALFDQHPSRPESDLSPMRNKDSILADTTEALLGAVYRQHGFEVAREVILRLFATKLESAHWIQDWKTLLQERVAELGGQPPVYIATVDGPEHEQVFTAQAVIGGIARGTGRGQNKKTAEQNAAREALFFLKEHPEALALAQRGE